eukprot:augustus_masked-scaffold_5-processed-gene-20.28-mRNA-1 protein AED:0.06 eAED:0.06 QI:0/-1/0/1/-1/1/1/0/341
MEDKETPICCIVIGMAGSGKSTMLRRLYAHLNQIKQQPYAINLDPAVHKVSFPANVDIRDTVNYSEVMKNYKLGPNGAITTSLNLFSTKFNGLIDVLKIKTNKFALFDTPGQIEVFTWSASGEIITKSLASNFRTVILYVIDTPRCESPTTFMSNMLYACSIFFKLNLPFIIVFNKTDVKSHDFASRWMQDFTAFEDALQKKYDAGEEEFIDGLSRSMSLVLDEFYSNLDHVGVSSLYGTGFSELLEKIEEKSKESTSYRSRQATTQDVNAPEKDDLVDPRRREENKPEKSVSKPYTASETVLTTKTPENSSKINDLRNENLEDDEKELEKLREFLKPHKC